MSRSAARAKGFGFERRLAKLFRELGYNCTTSRFSAKEQDYLGVDLVGTGNWSVQAKAVEKLGSLHTILDSMPKDGRTRLVFHKRNRQGVIVAMKEEDFFEIVKLLLEAKCISC
jgi:hypothetical protein